MIEKTELEILEDQLKVARKNATKAQKELKLAHEAIAEYEAGKFGIKRGENYYIKRESLSYKELKIGIRYEVIDFYRMKVGTDDYISFLRCLVNGKKKCFDVDIFAIMVGKKEGQIV